MHNGVVITTTRLKIRVIHLYCYGGRGGGGNADVSFDIRKDGVITGGKFMTGALRFSLFSSPFSPVAHHQI